MAMQTVHFSPPKTYSNISLDITWSLRPYGLHLELHYPRACPSIPVLQPAPHALKARKSTDAIEKYREQPGIGRKGTGPRLDLAI